MRFSVNQIPNISLENEKYIESAVASGLYQDLAKPLNAAIELLKQRIAYSGTINSGIDQLDNSLGRPFDIDVIMGRIDEQLRSTGK